MKGALLTFLSLLFNGLTRVRNWFYDHHWFRSTSFPSKNTIIVGNLAVGGTGKSPFVNYLIKHWPRKERIGILSRGYGRRSKGFRWVNSSSTVLEVGDEPLAYKIQFPDIAVAVCESRVLGVETMEAIDTVILDDAFQHRALVGSVNIVCTTFDKPFFKDQLMPKGRLRESVRGIERADIIVVNRCPSSITQADRYGFESFGRPVFYTVVTYGKPAKVFKKVHLIAGIADPAPFFAEASSHADVLSTRVFADHYNFQESDLIALDQCARSCASDEGLLTTHKDYVRLQIHFGRFPALAEKLQYLPMEIEFLEKENEFWQLLGSFLTFVP